MANNNKKNTWSVFFHVPMTSRRHRKKRTRPRCNWALMLMRHGQQGKSGALYWFIYIYIVGLIWFNPYGSKHCLRRYLSLQIIEKYPSPTS